MKALLLGLIRFYRAFISPLFPPSCRFQPTCSQYALGAIEQWGAGRGSWLAVQRVLRCHPFHPGGYDPVPLPGERRASACGCSSEGHATQNDTSQSCESSRNEEPPTPPVQEPSD